MSTFAELIVKPGVAPAYYLGVSLDHGATISYVYSTHWLPGVAASLALPTEPRISKLGPLNRAFGVDHGLASTSFEVELENTDGALDWISNRTTYATQAVASVWYYAVFVCDPLNPSDYQVQSLGYYQLKDPPARDGSRIRFTLVDKSLVDLQLSDMPTVRDWMAITDANRPTFIAAAYAPAGQQLDSSIAGAVPDFDIDAPIPLLFGSNALPIKRVQRNCYVVCSVAGSAGALPAAIDHVVLGNGSNFGPATNGATGSTYAPVLTNGAYTVWTARRTPDITKNGRTWHIIWLDLNLTNDPSADFGIIQSMLSNKGYNSEDTAKDFAFYGIHDLVAPVSVHGRLLSHNTNDVTWLGLSNSGLNAVTIAADLIGGYTRVAPSLDTASFARVLAARPEAKASGMVEVSTSLSTTNLGKSFRDLVDGDLIQALRAICQVGNFDVFFKWNGEIACAGSLSDYASQTATLASLDEALFDGTVSERIPGKGERGEPYNRLFVVIGSKRYGPVDDASAIATWGKVVPRQIDGTWMQNFDFIGSANFANGAPQFPNIEARFKSLGGSTVRPRLTVRTFLNGLAYELGDFITTSWSRGLLAGPYTSAVFRVEGITLDPMTNSVQLELVWTDDLRTSGNLPYVLDDETLSTRASGSGGRTATLTTGSNTVTFSSGDLLADGVTAGDHLIVLDSTEGATLFARNVALLVAVVTDATHLAISSTYSSNAFGAGGPFVLSTWEIRRGALNARANSSVYGKVGDSTHAGKFSDNSTNAYKLLDG